MKSVGQKMAAGVALAFAALAGTVLGDGFRNPPEGAAALGKAGARLAWGDDASAVTHNPANMMDIKDPTVMPALTIGYAKTEFSSPLGAKEQSKEPWRVIPSLYGVMPSDDGRFAFGFGVSSPYGQASKWDENGLFRYGTVYSEDMMTLNFSPAVAMRVSDTLYAGVGLDAIWSETEFRQNLPWFPPPAGLMGPGSRLVFKGDGYGVGMHAGATWQPAKMHRLALVYRSPVSIAYDGDFEIQNPPPPGALPPGVTPRSDFETDFDFPSVIAMGYGFAPNDRFRIEANVEWVEHSRMESFDLDLDNNNALLMAALGSTSLPQDWDDTWVLDLGADWRMTDACTLRCGYTYLPSPIPDRTFLPTFGPEADKHVFAAGIGLARDGHSLDLAYSYNLTDDRDITDNVNPAVNGSYSFDAHLFGVSYRLAF